MSTDRIEKRVLLKAPIARVWRAISDSSEFGRWFGVMLDGPFVAGRSVRGIFTEGLTPEMVAQIAEFQRSVGLAPAPVRTPAPDEVFCVVERMEAPRYFSFRWVPYGIDGSVDPATEPMTLVELRLEEQRGGTLVSIVESGFDKVPAHRRERAFRMNDAGWAAQAENLERHVQGN